MTSALRPRSREASCIASRLYCTSKAMWKLIWFLRDFTYDPERLSQSDVDERALRGLVGVVKIIHTLGKRHSDVPNCGLRSPVLAPHAAHEKEPDCSGPFRWFSL